MVGETTRRTNAYPSGGPGRAMVSLDTGSHGGSPAVYECSRCETTLVASRAPDDLVCCDESMQRLEGEAGLLREPSVDDVLRQVFGLSHNAIVSCIVVIERGPMTAAEVADVVGVSSNTVSSALGPLVDAGILERYERNLKRGGTVNVYESASVAVQQRIYRRGLYQWVRRAIEAINAFDLDDLKRQYRRDDPPADPAPERAVIYWESGPDGVR